MAEVSVKKQGRDPMIDVCCASLILIFLFAVLVFFIFLMFWRYYFRKLFRRKKGQKEVYRDGAGRTVVDVEDKDPDSSQGSLVQSQGSSEMKEKPTMVPKPPGRKRGLHGFMYSSVSYSTKDGKKWGKVVVTEKDGERTVERYGDLAKGRNKTRERDGDFVDVEAEEAEGEQAP